MIHELEIILKALGEVTRLKIVKLLSVQELCVCELEAILNISQPRVSQHLKVLKNAGIVNERKQKQKSYYSLSNLFQGGEVSVFKEFMTVNLNRLEDLSEESIRLAQLDSNEKVKRCKESLN